MAISINAIIHDSFCIRDAEGNEVEYVARLGEACIVHFIVHPDVELGARGYVTHGIAVCGWFGGEHDRWVDPQQAVAWATHAGF
jgi:hypothetical protein